MNADGLRLTVFSGERARADGGFLADALTGIFARHELTASVVLRGVEGFGAKQHHRTDRLLTLSEDLPLVSVAVDTRSRIEAVLGEVGALPLQGLVTLERVGVLADRVAAVEPPRHAHVETRLTAYVGRGERVDGMPAHEAVVALLHARGVAGATVLLGVDGTVHGVRKRARLFGRNGGVPAMVVAVGDSARIAAVVPELATLLARPPLTVEPVQVCKRDGRTLAPPRRLPDRDDAGAHVWQKLEVFTGEQAHADGRPLHQRLVRDLRAAGARGATSLRGVWGYHGDHRPHGDTLWQLRRRAPIVTVVIDTPARIRRWFAIVDRRTRATGLVTCATVPALRATAPGLDYGALRLADHAR